MTSHNTQFRQASNHIDLSLPTDRELCQIFMTTIATSYPEDFPGFSPDIHIEHEDLEERIDSVTKTLSAHFPFWAPCAEKKDSRNIALERSARLSGFSNRTVYENKFRLNGFFILKHSTLISPEQDIANQAKLYSSSVTSPFAWEEKAFLSTQHEIAHIVQYLKNEFIGDDFHSKFRAEWGADAYALYQYTQRQEDPLQQKRIIDTTIANRAVAGFLFQPPHYWIAPFLKETFANPESRNGRFKATPDPARVFLSYEELRLRTIAFLMGDATLNNYSSQHWEDAIRLKDQCQLKEIRNMPLRFELEKQEERFRSQWFDQHRKSGAALRALSYITEYANLSSFTRSCGQQIIEGARLICPSLLQDPIRKMDTHPTRDPA